MIIQNHIFPTTLNLYTVLFPWGSLQEPWKFRQDNKKQGGCDLNVPSLDYKLQVNRV